MPSGLIPVQHGVTLKSWHSGAQHATGEHRLCKRCLLWASRVLEKVRPMVVRIVDWLSVVLAIPKGAVYGVETK
eukprot:5783983-Amphidinium_carterae.1